MDNTRFVVEQAVFSVTLRKNSMNDVFLEESSPGAADNDLLYAKDLASRVTLPGSRLDYSNFFGFFRPDGTCVFGRVTPHNGPIGSKSDVYFQCLFLDYETFCFAGANPESLITSALNTSFYSCFQRGNKLRSFELTESSPRFNTGMLKDALTHVGCRTLALLVQTVLENEQTFLISKNRLLPLISSVFSFMPIHARGGLSVASELFFRGIKQRLTAVQVVPDARFDLRKLDLDDSVAVLDLDYAERNSDEYQLTSAWGTYVDRALALNAVNSFLVCLAQDADRRDGEHPFEPTPCLTTGEIEELGRAGLESLVADDDYSDDEEEAEELDGDEIDDADGAPYQDYASPDGWREDEQDDGDDWKSDAAGTTQDEWSAVANMLNSSTVDSADDSLNQLSNSIEIIQVYIDDVARKTDPELTGISGDVDSVDDDLDDVLADSDSYEDVDSDVSTVEHEQETARIISDGAPLALGPFVVLSAEFPDKNIELRQLDRLVNASCESERDALLGLENFWQELTLNCNSHFLQRVRSEYLSSLRRKVQMARTCSPEIELARTLNIIDVVEVICILSE